MTCKKKKKKLFCISSSHIHSFSRSQEPIFHSSRNRNPEHAETSQVPTPSPINDTEKLIWPPGGGAFVSRSHSRHSSASIPSTLAHPSGAARTTMHDLIPPSVACHARSHPKPTSHGICSSCRVRVGLWTGGPKKEFNVTDFFGGVCKCGSTMTLSFSWAAIVWLES